jgi:hypothetical protein
MKTQQNSGEVTAAAMVLVQTIGHKRRIPPQKNHAMQLTKEITSIE